MTLVFHFTELARLVVFKLWSGITGGFPTSTARARKHYKGDLKIYLFRDRTVNSYFYLYGLVAGWLYFTAYQPLWVIQYQIFLIHII